MNIESQLHIKTPKSTWGGGLGGGGKCNSSHCWFKCISRSVEVSVTLYWLSFTPAWMWLDVTGQLAATSSEWASDCEAWMKPISSIESALCIEIRARIIPHSKCICLTQRFWRNSRKGFLKNSRETVGCNYTSTPYHLCYRECFGSCLQLLKTLSL